MNTKKFIISGFLAILLCHCDNAMEFTRNKDQRAAQDAGSVQPASKQESGADQQRVSGSEIGNGQTVSGTEIGNAHNNGQGPQGLYLSCQWVDWQQDPSYVSGSCTLQRQDEALPWQANEVEWKLNGLASADYTLEKEQDRIAVQSIVAKEILSQQPDFSVAVTTPASGDTQTVSKDYSYDKEQAKVQEASEAGPDQVSQPDEGQTAQTNQNELTLLADQACLASGFFVVTTAMNEQSAVNYCASVESTNYSLKLADVNTTNLAAITALLTPDTNYWIASWNDDPYTDGCISLTNTANVSESACTEQFQLICQCQ